MKSCECEELVKDCNDCRAWMIEERNHIGDRIILHKALYYYPEKFPTKILNKWSAPDETYDGEEKWYLKLTDMLGLVNELVHDVGPTMEHLGIGMMEIDWNNPRVIKVLTPYLKE